MATRHTLGVAASTLALAASCLAGALPASASTVATFPTAISIAAAPNASALPTDAEIKEAKKNKDKLEGAKEISEAFLERLKKHNQPKE